MIIKAAKHGGFFNRIGGRRPNPARCGWKSKGLKNCNRPDWGYNKYKFINAIFQEQAFSCRCAVWHTNPGAKLQPVDMLQGFCHL